MQDHSTTFMPPDADLERIGRRGLIVGIAAAAVLVAGAFATGNQQQFFRSYLTAFTYVLAGGMGCLGFWLVHLLSRGQWGVMIRRILEAGAKTIPLLGILFIPVLFGLHSLYEWSHKDVVAADPILRHKAAYLNETGFLIRGLGYFVLLTGLAFVLTSLSRREDETGDPAVSHRMQAIAGPGLIAYFILLSLAAVDWMMSLTPHWFSTIYGFLYVISMGVTGLGFVILMARWLGPEGKKAVPFQDRHYHDYGKLLFATATIWAYFQASQLIIIWSGNLPEETPWYVTRLHTNWKWITIAVVVLNWALPFFLLLSRDRKRRVTRLAPIAALLMVAHWLDIHWLIAPAFSPSGITFHWLDFVAPVALGGIWFWYFTLQLRKRPVVPVHGPYLKEALEVSHAH
ncbi:MAG: hypothetical protein L6R30_22170 [Thermoanaerobaculia bacterium]|nr:hypothetical protein [Thermoanaerobaculia bacterium]MCK6685119.1 hypothetical protein [Thermoanaerobaculia bacterium]